MESFCGINDAGRYEVYTGFWTDWTNGPVFGATITLSKREASVLIAFTALFVSVVGTSFWRICCFALHQYHSKAVAQDALYHQRQAIFRNAANGSSGLWALLRIWWEWRKTAVDRPSLRLLPAVGFAACCVSIFAVAGMLSSKTLRAANGVLVRSPGCGILDVDNNPNLEDALSDFYPWVAQAIGSWATYAQDCYLNFSDLGSCNAFMQPRLPSRIERNASCPFEDGICENEYGNIEFDSYLDSHFDLGLNAPPHERVFFRRVTTCDPIRTEGHRTMYRSPETGMNYSRYHYGPTTGGYSAYEYTYEHPEIDWRSAPGEWETGSVSGDRYTVHIRRAVLSNGSYTGLSGYDPIPALRQQDADVHVFFLSANSILYTEKVSDAWYAATTKSTAITSTEHGRTIGRIPTYKADRSVSVLGCSIREQYCNPNLPADEGCSPFGGTHESRSLADDLQWKDGKQRAAFDWLSAIIQSYSITVEAIPGDLREGALLATYKAQAAISGGLPSNQWQLEAENWHAATLVALQASVTKVAKGTTDDKLKPFLRLPNNKEERNLCNSQVT
ncbi:cytochrome p450 protein [Diplodia corticola]|uniref:Cytochrome p450 protein n=1 Tax=Diplodia corticola TaxID=236234 RepID=A0A1J9QP89_9PEZI|nr:cytochrome p450 protein [Diplodia corticola]OJD29866.1 cytochrome p450 protein [Diplodia corticola]